MKNTVTLFITCTSLLFADINLSGYLKNTTSIMIDNGKNELFTDVAELRLESDWDWDNGGMEVHLITGKSFRPIVPFFEVYRENSLMMGLVYEFINSELQLTDSQMDTLTDESNDGMNELLTEEEINELIKLGQQLPYSSQYPSTKINLDRALIKLYLPFVDIFIGRQPIAWGTGYAFNPTDLWNLKSATDAEAPKMGLNALRFEIPLGSLAGISLVASPGKEFKYSSGGFRFKWNLGRFDMSLSGISLMNADREMFRLKRKVVAGTDLVGQLGDVGVWYEVAVSNRIYDSYTNFDSLFTQVDLGADYTFRNGLYIMGEYLYNSLGKDNYKDYNTNDMVAVLAGEAPGMGQHYLFGGVRQEFLGQLNISCFALANIQDLSGAVMPEIAYTFNDHIEVKLKTSVTTGSSTRSEYGSIKSATQLTICGYF